MNLMKLINFNFIKENIKKSLGILLFLFFIIPIVNILYLNEMKFHTRELTHWSHSDNFKSKFSLL